MNQAQSPAAQKPNPIGYISLKDTGHVFWKGVEVEHYSHDDRDAKQEALQRLAYRCQALEDNGFPVNSRTAISPLFFNAPAGTPWVFAMNHYYSLVEGTGRKAAIFYLADGNGAIVLERHPETQRLQTQWFYSGHQALHAMQAQGLKSNTPVSNYGYFADFLTAAGLLPADIESAVNSAKPPFGTRH